MAILVDEGWLRKLLDKSDSDRSDSRPYTECIEEFIEGCKKVKTE